jgi:hypothetical protein
MSLITKGLGSKNLIIASGLGISFEIIGHPEIQLHGIPGGHSKKKKFLKDVEKETTKHIKNLIATNSITVPSHLKFIDVKVSVEGDTGTNVQAEIIKSEPIIVRVTI